MLFSAIVIPTPSIVSKGVQYHCDYCRKDMTGAVRIKCAECANFDLCVECFSQVL